MTGTSSPGADRPAPRALAGRRPSTGRGPVGTGRAEITQGRANQTGAPTVTTGAPSTSLCHRAVFTAGLPRSITTDRGRLASRRADLALERLGRLCRRPPARGLQIGQENDLLLVSTITSRTSVIFSNVAARSVPPSD